MTSAKSSRMNANTIQVLIEAMMAVSPEQAQKFMDETGEKALRTVESFIKEKTAAL